MDCGIAKEFLEVEGGQAFVTKSTIPLREEFDTQAR